MLSGLSSIVPRVLCTAADLPFFGTYCVAGCEVPELAALIARRVGTDIPPPKTLPAPCPQLGQGFHRQRIPAA